MGKICEWATYGGNYVIADFVCPIKECRSAFNPDYIIYINRIKSGRFEDTNKLFDPPKNPDLILTDQSLDIWVKKSLKLILNGGGGGS